MTDSDAPKPTGPSSSSSQDKKIAVSIPSWLKFVLGGAIAVLIFLAGSWFGLALMVDQSTASDAQYISEPTLIALVFFLFITIVLAMVIIKENADKGMEMLTRLAAVFGVLIGAIPTFYYAQKVNESEVNQAKAQTQQSVTVKKAAADKLNPEVEKIDSTISKVQELLADSNKTTNIPDSERKRLVNELGNARESVSEIKMVEKTLKEDAVFQWSRPAEDNANKNTNTNP